MTHTIWHMTSTSYFLFILFCFFEDLLLSLKINLIKKMNEGLITLVVLNWFPCWGSLPLHLTSMIFIFLRRNMKMLQLSDANPEIIQNVSRFPVVTDILPDIQKLILTLIQEQNESCCSNDKGVCLKRILFKMEILMISNHDYQLCDHVW